jgi:Aspartyl/Asparaginyl beta-hydroxylase
VTDVRALERAIQANPGKVALHRDLALTLREVILGDDPEGKLSTITRELPFAFTTLLHLGRLIELRRDTHAAVLMYTRAIKTAQLAGFWYDEGSTPQWLREPVLHAMQYAARGKVEVFRAHLERWVAKYGDDEMERVAKCLGMYLGTFPLQRSDPRQQPSFLYFPGLPVHPVFPRDALPFADWFESETDAIRDEALRAAGHTRPFHYDVPEAERGKLTRGDWDAYFFYADGEREDAHHAECSHTSSVLARLPLDHVRDHGPEVCFSVMRPGAHILPHRGVTNTRAVLHLGLEIPPDCALALVGVQQVTWTRGRCFAFDDTFQHEAWNRSDATRIILLCDIWNPYLRPAEREALGDLVAQIGDFNSATAVTR